MAKLSTLKISVASSIFLTFFAIGSLSYVVFNFYQTGLVIFLQVLPLTLLVSLALLNGFTLVLSMLTLAPKTANVKSFQRLRMLSNLIILAMVASLTLLTLHLMGLTPSDPTRNLSFLIFINALSLIGPVELFIEVEVLKMNLTDSGIISTKKR
jgi:hypothetical protein